MRTSRATDVPLDASQFARILAEYAPIEHTSVGLAYRFPESLPPVSGTRMLRATADSALLHPLLAAWAPDIEASSPLVASMADGQAVAVCASVRKTPLAHEAGLETAAPFRGRGFGHNHRRRAAAWWNDLGEREANVVYWTRGGDIQSQRVAIASEDPDGREQDEAHDGERERVP